MFVVAHMFSYTISWLPLNFLTVLAKCLAFFCYKVLKLRKKTIFKNLDIAFGNEKSTEEKERIAYSSYYHFMLTILEFLYFRKGDLSQNTYIENDGALREALAKGEGAYVIAMHMSNWELSASVVSQHIRPVYVVVKPVGSLGINNFVTQLRTRNGMNVIFRKSIGDAVRKMKQTLKAGHIVAVIMDQRKPGEPYIPFFGKPARTNTSFAAIWSRLPAPVFMAYSRRESIGKHRLTFKEPLFLQNTGEREKDVLANTQLINERLEMCIRECPEQYFWLHDRWK